MSTISNSLGDSPQVPNFKGMTFRVYSSAVLRINAYAQANDHERAAQWLLQMSDFRLKPSVLQYTQVLQSLGGCEVG